MTTYEYVPQGVCPTLMKVFIDEQNDTLQSVGVLGGCHGYFTAMVKILKGWKVEDAIKVLEGVQCGNRGTSCPDQLAKALQVYVDRKEAKK